MNSASNLFQYKKIIRTNRLLRYSSDYTDLEQVTRVELAGNSLGSCRHTARRHLHKPKRAIRVWLFHYSYFFCFCQRFCPSLEGLFSILCQNSVFYHFTAFAFAVKFQLESAQIKRFVCARLHAAWFKPLHVHVHQLSAIQTPCVAMRVRIIIVPHLAARASQFQRLSACRKTAQNAKYRRARNLGVLFMYLAKHLRCRRVMQRAKCVVYNLLLFRLSFLHTSFLY